MSRNGFRGASSSPIQRRACLVLVLCVLAVIVTFVCAWIVPGMLAPGKAVRRIMTAACIR